MVLVVLTVATLLTALVAGFLLAFALVVMPGLRRLDDAGFIRAFQVIDGVIQTSQPIFVGIWLGSVIAVVVSLVLPFWALSGVDRWAVVWAAAFYLAGVQLPTAVINVPLNNVLQRVDVGALGPGELRQARGEFEGRWNRANVTRTVCAAVASAPYLTVVARL